MLPKEKVQNLIDRHLKLEKELSSGKVEKKKFAEISKEYSDLNDIIKQAKEYLSYRKDLQELNNIINDKSSDDEIKDFASSELETLKSKYEINEKKIKLFLLPKDLADSKNAIIEIRAGTGGLEASLFASDLYKMYEKVSQKKNWNIEIISISKSDAGGIKVGGSKLLLILPLIGTLGGGLWAGFEFYKDYMDMKEQIQSYVAPDLSGFDKQLAVIQEEMKVTKEEVLIIRDAIGEQVQFMRDTKHDLREDLVRMERILDKVENDIDAVEDEATSLMDRSKKDTRDMIVDANNRFNDKIDGMEGYVKRELQSLEDELNTKLTKALDNPLANRNN